jgi:hypothetical protein
VQRQAIPITGGTIDFGGGRARGGPVAGDRLYEVGEGGAPELFKQNGRTYLIPGSDGMVLPAAPSIASQYASTPRTHAGGQPSIEFNVINNSSAEVGKPEVKFDEFGKLIVNMAVNEVDRRINTMGTTGRAMQQRFGLQPQGVTRG